MHKTRYVFSHAFVPLIVFVLLAVILTSGVWYVLSQRRSMQNGLEVLLVDTALSLGENEQLAQSIRQRTGVNYVGVSTLSSEETMQYVSTIENYTLEAHVQALARSRDAELLFVPEPFLADMMTIALPLEMDVSANETCYLNGILYALPVSGLAVTDYGASLTALDRTVYALVLPGDHTADARVFLKSLTNKSTQEE